MTETELRELVRKTHALVAPGAGRTLGAAHRALSRPRPVVFTLDSDAAARASFSPARNRRIPCS